MLDQPFRFCAGIATPWGTSRVRVGVATEDIGLIELERRIPQVFWDILSLRQLLQQVRHRVPPDHGPHLLEERLDGLLSRLLCRETRPVIERPLDIAAGVLEIPSGLV